MPKTLGSLSVGDTIEVPVLSAYQSRFGSKIVFKIADKNHSDYPSNSVTLITEKIIQNMAIDAAEPNNSNSDRQTNGNNRHIYSNILQWLNSNAAAGEWYSAKHSADASPTTKGTDVTDNPYTSWAGFLAMLDTQFVAKLLDTTLTVVKSAIDGGGYETFTAKMFLASNTEVGFANENDIAEGTKLSLFTDYASRIAYPTEECVNNSDNTDSDLSTSNGWDWWLRTPSYLSSYFVHCVSLDSTLGGRRACAGLFGVRPLCNLSSSVLVSDDVNTDGNYEMVYNNYVDFADVKKIVIPEGEVKQIADASDNILWSGVSNVWKKYNAVSSYALDISSSISYPGSGEPDDIYTGYTITSSTTYTKTGKKTWKYNDNFTLNNAIVVLNNIDYFGYVRHVYEYDSQADEETEYWDIVAHKILGVKTTYSQGTYIEDVESDNENAYPTNGYQDGYWYVKVSENT